MIGLSGCPVTQNDWCVRRCRLSVVKDHDGPCPSLCVSETVDVHTLACLFVLLAYQPAGMRERSVYDFQPQIDVMYRGVTNVLPVPAVFYLGLMGTYLPYSLIKLGLIQRRLWSRVGSRFHRWDISSQYFVLNKLVQTNPYSLCFTPDLPYDLWLGQCGDADL